ncbi:hypothetical protein F4810DRAFT_271826 [Camillea tinctor]|nr:hypothetical protein F4810DRAFT_271826 [Camillea tinctor]
MYAYLVHSIANCVYSRVLVMVVVPLSVCEGFYYPITGGMLRFEDGKNRPIMFGIWSWREAALGLGTYVCIGHAKQLNSSIK